MTLSLQSNRARRPNRVAARLRPGAALAGRARPRGRTAGGLGSDPGADRDGRFRRAAARAAGPRRPVGGRRVLPGRLRLRRPRGGRGAGQPWTATTWTLNTLREWGLDAAVLRERRTAELLAANCRWEYENLPYWGGEVDCCINALDRSPTASGSAPTSPASPTGSSSTDWPTAGGTASGSRARRARRSTPRSTR